MIFFFGASLLLSRITGVLMTLIFFPSGNRKTAAIPWATSPARGRPEAASPKAKQVPVKGKTARK
jgi:hypothetical protein